jgi:hypothetical protein
MEELFTVYVRQCFQNSFNNSSSSSKFEDRFSERYMEEMIKVHDLPAHARDVLIAVAVTSEMRRARLTEEILAILHQNKETSGSLSCALCAKTVYKNKIVRGAEFFILHSSTISGEETKSDVCFLCCSTHARLVENTYGITHICVDLNEYIQEICSSAAGESAWEKMVAPRHRTLPVSQWKKTRSSPPLTPVESEIIRYWNCIKLWTDPPAPAVPPGVPSAAAQPAGGTEGTPAEDANKDKK